jgi:cobalt-zinc-cadmium efflux system protein
VVAVVGVAVNLVATSVIAGGGRRSLTSRIPAPADDLYAFIATAVAAAIILATGFDRADAWPRCSSPP